MSKASERVKQIETEQVGQTGKRVLLVEGIDDVDAYSIFLSKKFPQWEQSWALADAGNKKQVLEALVLKPNWIGLVDRDEWSDGVQTAYLANHANLLILPRFCLESYLISPAELWQAFPEKQRAKVVGGEAALRAALLASLTDWIRHAALWHGVRPLWQKLRTAGFPDDVTKVPPTPTDQELQTFFSNWHGLLDANALLSAVHTFEGQLKMEDEETVCKLWLHAKHFYPEVVHRTLDQLLGVKPAKERRLSIFRSRSVPVDLDVVWQKMGLL